jgi:nucleoid DNA-binding protein
MTTKARAGMEELALRVQAALSLATKKEAACLVNVFVSCLEDTLVRHLAEDGFCFKLNGFGKFIVRHSPPIRRKIGFSGETREIPPKRRVKFLSLGRLRQLETVRFRGDVDQRLGLQRWR